MAEKKVIELDVQSNLGSLKSQLKQAQQEVQTLSDKFGATSTQAVAAAKKAAILKDKIGDAKSLTDAFNPDAKFKALSGSLTGVAGGFSAITGAMGAFGTQSEDVEKALLKVQSAMALASGLQAVGESVDSFKQLGGVIKDSYQKLLLFIAGQETQAVVATEVAVATQVEAVATEEATVAQISLNAAMKANPIGVVIVGVVALGAAIAGLIYAMGDHNKAADKQAETNKRLAEQAKEQRQNIAKESGEFATLITRLKNTNEGSKERADLIKKINGQYGTTLKNIKDETKFQESLNKELASYLEYQKAKYTLQKNEDLIVKNLEKQDELRAKIAKAEKDRNQAIADGAGKQKRTLEEGIITYVNLNEEADKALKKANETISKSNKELEAAEKRFNAYGSAANNAAKNVDKLTNSGTKYVEQTTDKIDKVEENNEKEFESYDKLEYKKAQLLKHSELTLQGHINETVKLQTDAAEHEIAILEAKAIKAAQLEEKSQSQKLKLAKAGFDTIAQITELFGRKSEAQARKAFKVQKAASMASALITTYQSARSAYASQFVPLPDPSSPVRGAIAAGIAIASGLANVAKIGQQKFEGGTPPSDTPPPSANIGGGSVISPNFNVVGNSGLNQLGQLQQKPMKAYVVSGDMTTAQSLDRNRIENATLVQ